MRKYSQAPARTISLPPPVGGWNARDSLASMSNKDAVTLENIWPLTTDVMFRRGYTRFAYGFSNQVQTLEWYSSGSANKLIAAEGTKIWDITAGGDFSGGSPAVSGLTNAKWQSINITTAGGSFLLMVNGADKMRIYNGTTWDSDGGGTYTVTGINTTQATNINLFKNRVWFCQTQTLKAWYLPTNSIAGAALSFDFSAIAKHGGYLMTMLTWTMDAGYGMDDMAVWLTSNGEVIVYRGTDPASASTWSLVGVFEIGAPIGRRAGIKYGGDIVVMTQDGLVPLGQAIQSSRLDPRVALTDKIQQAVSEAATLYSANFGWQVLYYAKENMLILNIPVAEGSQQQQFAMNTISKSWCNFTGITANCWSLFNDDPYFGANGYVGHFWNAFSDYPGTTAQPIQARALQAFNYCGSNVNKHFRMMRPILNTDGQPAIYVNVNVDFDQSITNANLSYSASNLLPWDIALWDQGQWSGGLAIQKAWQGANQIGFCAAPQIQGQSSGIETHWMATDLVYATGGVL